MQGESGKQRTWMKNTGNLSKYFTHEFTCNTGNIFTVRNEVAKVMFLQACVCPHGGVSASVHAGMRPQSRHPPAADTTPPAGADTPLGADTPPGADTPLGADTPQEQTPPPPDRRPLLRTVCILLECIFVKFRNLRNLGRLK